MPSSSQHMEINHHIIGENPQREMYILLGPVLDSPQYYLMICFASVLYLMTKAFLVWERVSLSANQWC